MICYGNPPCADTIFPGFCRHSAPQRGVHGVVSLGGVVKTLGGIVIHYPVVFLVRWGPLGHYLARLGLRQLGLPVRKNRVFQRIHIREKQRGVENSGEGKTYHKTPSQIGVQETVLLVNHALARGTPAIFVIFVVSRGSSSKALVLLVRMQIRHFRHFRQKPPFFWRDKSTVYQKHRFRDPDQKRFWTPPTCDTFPPPLCFRPVVFLGGSRHRAGKSHSLRPPKLVLEGALYGTIPPPQNRTIRFAPPLATFQFSKNPHLRAPNRDCHCRSRNCAI